MTELQKPKLLNSA